MFWLFALVSHHFETLTGYQISPFSPLSTGTLKNTINCLRTGRPQDNNIWYTRWKISNKAYPRDSTNVPFQYAKCVVTLVHQFKKTEIFWKVSIHNYTESPLLESPLLLRQLSSWNHQVPKMVFFNNLSHPTLLTLLSSQQIIIRKWGFTDMGWLLRVVCCKVKSKRS